MGDGVEDRAGEGVGFGWEDVDDDEAGDCEEDLMEGCELAGPGGRFFLLFFGWGRSKRGGEGEGGYTVGGYGVEDHGPEGCVPVGPFGVDQRHQ